MYLLLQYTIIDLSALNLGLSISLTTALFTSLSLEMDIFKFYLTDDGATKLCLMLNLVTIYLTVYNVAVAVIARYGGVLSLRNPLII